MRQNDPNFHANGTGQRMADLGGCVKYIISRTIELVFALFYGLILLYVNGVIMTYFIQHRSTFIPIINIITNADMVLTRI